MNAPPFRFILLTVLVVSCVCGGHAAGPDLSECFGPYRIQPYVRVAAALQALPEAERAAQLRAWAQAKPAGAWYGPLDDQVIRLCRILFERKPGARFRASYQGLPIFASQALGRGAPETTDEIERLWPDAPFLFFEDVPFDAASRGHMLAGARESGERYLAYCLEEARWTSRDYAKVLALDLEAVLIRLMNNYPWPGELSRHDREFLAAQIKPYEVPRLSGAIRTSGGGQGTQGVSSMSVSKKTQRLERVETLAIAVMGGVRPYHYLITVDDRVVERGIGGTEPINPFSWQDFPMPWPMAAKDGVRFELTDAVGATLVQRINVIDPSTLEAFPPEVVNAKTAPATGKKL